VWWPLSKDIADASTALGLATLHEVNKSHPRDWENPGRVRVQWKKDGRLMNPMIRTSECCSYIFYGHSSLSMANSLRATHVLFIVQGYSGPIYENHG
jgi:hypothetical protein